MAEFSIKSRVRDIYGSNLGRDIIDKLMLQMNIRERLLKNPIVMGMSLASLRRLVGKRLDASVWDAILALLNVDSGAAVTGDAESTVTDDVGVGVVADGNATATSVAGDAASGDSVAANGRKWWKESVFYQIYPRSFYDTNGDGIGDIPGITAKLDYLQELGVDALWLCPIYDSPQDDNGYDIRNYRAIDPMFGTMEDFDVLLAEVHRRGMRLIMDLVVNHTSDEHEWFRKATSEPESKYRDYYFIRSSADGKPPNNWGSFFSGSAWKDLPGSDDWALCLFSKKQADLNWDNPEMRGDVYSDVRWWLEKGVDGFRLDVINFISKTPGLPDGNEFIGGLMGVRGIEHFFYGPKLHDYLHEMYVEAFEPYGAFSVGETPGIGFETGKLLTADSRGELNMMFSFDHLETPGKSKFDDYAYNAAFLKKYYSRWMRNYANECSMSLFYDNHDNPRMLSKIDPEGRYRDKLAMLLAVIQFTLRGTPFIYQGQELGAVNASFGSIDELRDVESINLYTELIEKMPDEEAMRIINAGTRDHARVPMQWDSSPQSGFTEGEPWIKTVPDGHDAVSQSDDEGSVLSFFKRMIGFRRGSDALIYGEIDIIKTKESIFAYTRRSGEDLVYVECNLSPEKRKRPGVGPGANLVLSSYPENAGGKYMMAYEAGVYQITKSS